MTPRAKAILAACCLALVVASATAAVADCPAGAPTGLYRGLASGEASDRTEVTLNLACAKGRYLAQFFTSQGDFEASSVTGGAGRVSASIDTDAARGEVDLALSGEGLSGSFSLAGPPVSLALARIGPALEPGAMKPRLDLTPAQWREDLRVFAIELPKRHANAFSSLDRSEFDAEIADLDRRIPRLNADEVVVGLSRIANSLGDGHTGLRLPPDRFELPIEIGRFGDDFRITAVGPGLGQALGARVLRIGDVPIAEAWRRALTLTPRGELSELREGRALYFLTEAMLLHGLDITPGRADARFDLLDDTGKASRIDVRGVAPGAAAPMRSAAGPASLAKQNPSKAFWCRALASPPTVYCAFHAYPDLRARAAEMFALIDKVHPQKLIIDMRDNGGGDFTEGDAWLISPLEKRADLNVKGRLYVLIGALTFSAAMNNAAQFQDETNAILVGQTIGEKPNSYQEPRQFRLPNSHLVVRASTRYYAFRKHGENAIRPEKEIIPTWDDVKAGRDPALDWVLTQPPR